MAEKPGGRALVLPWRGVGPFQLRRSVQPLLLEGWAPWGRCPVSPLPAKLYTQGGSADCLVKRKRAQDERVSNAFAIIHPRSVGVVPSRTIIAAALPPSLGGGVGMPRRRADTF